ncbi:MAG: glycosyltransferase family 4 protein [bacterium]
MRIAHVVSSFPPVVGGMGEVCFQEAKLLAGKGHEIEVFTLKYPKKYLAESIENFENQNSSVFKINRMIGMPRIGYAGLLPHLFFKLKGFDLVHLHYPFYGSAHHVFNARLFWRVNYVVTYHMDAVPDSAIGRMLAFFYGKQNDSKIFRSAKKIICVDRDFFNNSRLRSKIKNMEDKIEFISNGIDGTIIKSGSSDHKSKPFEIKKEKYILFVGNFFAIKGLRVLMEAFSKISDNTISLAVVGGASDEKMARDIENYAKQLNIRERMVFVGRIFDKKELSEYYKSALCCVVPSSFESFSIVALESLACACPVIASNVPGIASRVRHGVNGFLFKINDSVDLSARLNEIISMPESQRKSMGVAGRQEVVEKYSWEDHISKLEQVYKSAG